MFSQKKYGILGTLNLKQISYQLWESYKTEQPLGQKINIRDRSENVEMTQVFWKNQIFNKSIKRSINGNFLFFQQSSLNSNSLQETLVNWEKIFIAIKK